jgi:RHS repeat-associated protein
MGTNKYGYVFDPIGNRITATNNAEVTAYAANELNQYTNILSASAPPREPSHDLDGNMLTNGVWSYVWDGENRLIGVSSNGVLLATHTYDHLSRRIGKVAGETTQSYLYDGWNLIQEFQSSTIPTFHSSTNSYVWGLDLSGSLQGAGGVGGLLAVVQEGDAHYPAFDANGNVVEYVSADGAIAAHYEYSPFGETFAKSGDLADSFACRFSTKYWENEGGLYYYGYRFYLPTLGRWLSRDPINELGFRTVNYPDDPELYESVAQLYAARKRLRHLQRLEQILGISAGRLSGELATFVHKFEAEAHQRMSGIAEVTAEYNLYPMLGNNVVDQVDNLGLSPVLAGAAGGCFFIDGPLPFGDIIGLTLLWCCARDIVDNPPQPRECNPCIPAVGSGSFEVHVVPPHKPHRPLKGTHTHHFVMHQSPWPVCKCFWQRNSVKPTAGASPFPTESPIADASGGGPK